MIRSTVSKSIARQKLQSPQKYLLLGYLTTITTIVGIHTTFCYISSARNFEKQLDERLLTLVRAATPSFCLVRAKERYTAAHKLAWRYLFSNQKQSLEWFDASGKLVAREGSDFPKIPLLSKFLSSPLHKNSPLFQQKDRLRSVTIAVYVNNFERDIVKGKKPFLKGYIRASLPTQEISTALAQQRREFYCSGILAIILLGLSSYYLTGLDRSSRSSILPNLERITASSSHHFRHFLTKISLSVDLMLSRKEAFQASDLKKLERINVATKQMQRLVEDLLFLIRTDLEKQTNEIKNDRVLLNGLLDNTIADFESTIQAKKITLKTDLPINLAVRGDATQLIQLFSHLLKNAIEYTEANGNITLALGRSQEWAIISIKDTGMGILPEHFPLIFQWFWRSEQAMTRHPEGLGLGLAIAEAIVSQHGGKIAVSSQAERGSCFQVSLPLA
jgi:two-component system, OmpR family, manganese sensing sensor histidine kinase